jgi:hypothetical protein
MGVGPGGPLGLPLAVEPRPRVPLPGQWTFWADTMVGARPLGNVDVSSFYCVKRLSAFGHGNVTVNLPSGLDTQRMLTLWSWRLWAFYDGEPYWCGVPTGVADQDGSAHVQFTLIELPGYLTRRQWSEYYPDRRYTQAEQTSIARDIAEPLADVGVPIITEPGFVVLRDRRYEYLEGGSRGQLLINLAGVLQGPEFRADYRMTTAGRPLCTLRIAYPRVGSDISGLGLSVPGAVVGYRAQWDSDQLRTRTFAVGDLPHDAGEDDVRPVVVAEMDPPNPELPRLDAVDDWPGTVLPSTLAERAKTAAQIQSVPGQQISGSPPESFPPITSYGPGDTVTITAITPLAPQGVEFAGRLQQIEVNAATGIATWTVTLTNPPQRLRESLAGGLVRLDTATSVAFRSGGLRIVPGGST